MGQNAGHQPLLSPDTVGETSKPHAPIPEASNLSVPADPAAVLLMPRSNQQPPRKCYTKNSNLGGSAAIAYFLFFAHKWKYLLAFFTSRAICSRRASTEGNLISSRRRSRKQISTSVSGVSSRG
jgi:hypothetical protein